MEQKQANNDRTTGLKILVTGAAGFIGFHLCRRLLERGDQVIGLDNLSDYYDVSLKESRLKILYEKENFSSSRWISIQLKQFRLSDTSLSRK